LQVYFRIASRCVLVHEGICLCSIQGERGSGQFPGKPSLALPHVSLLPLFYQWPLRRRRRRPPLIAEEKKVEREREKKTRHCGVRSLEERRRAIPRVMQSNGEGPEVCPCGGKTITFPRKKGAGALCNSLALRIFIELPPGFCLSSARAGPFWFSSLAFVIPPAIRQAAGRPPTPLLEVFFR